MSDHKSELLTNTADLVAEIGDATLISALSDGPLDEVPVLGAIVKLYRGQRSIRDLLFERKLLAFLTITTKVSSEKKARFRERLEREPDLVNKTGEHLVTMLDRFEDHEKASTLARIFVAFLDGRIAFEEFRRLSHVLDRTILSDLCALRDYVRAGRQLTRAEFDGLETVGLVAIQHSIVRAIEPDEHQGRIDFAGTSLLFRVTRIAALLVETAF